MARDLAGEPAREEAREDATMALARESTLAAEADIGRRFGLVMPRLGGREGWLSGAETNESSEEA